MSDVTISYKGESIAAMDASGTKTLQTSGKYCEGDITVQYADPEKPTQTKSVTPSESAQTVTPDSGKVLSSVSVGAVSSTYVGSGVTRKAAATYTPGTADQTIAAGQYLNGAQTVKGDANLVAGNIKDGVTIFGVTGTHSGGTTPSGSITITDNGTYDVTDKASAVVTVPQISDIRVYEFTLTEEKTSTFKIADGDAWTLAHRTDANLVSAVSRDDVPEPPSSGNYVVRSVVGNFKVNNVSGLYLGVNTSGTEVRGWEYGGTTGGTGGAISIWTDGSIYIGASSTIRLAPGKYRAVLFLI